MILRSNVRPAEGFGAKEYEQAVRDRQLGIMHFLCDDVLELSKLRRRVLSAAYVRNHVINTTAYELKHEGKHLLTVAYKGTLPEPHLRP